MQEVKRTLRECHEVARANLVQTKQQRIAKQTAKVHVPKVQEGDTFLLRNEKAGKLDSPWLGPYTIVEVHSSKVNVVLELNRRKRMKVHINRLKKYHF